MDITEVRMLDITAPETQVVVELQERANGYVLYVHVEGMTVLRICQIKEKPLVKHGSRRRLNAG